MRSLGRNDVYILDRAWEVEPQRQKPALKTESPQFIALLRRHNKFEDADPQNRAMGSRPMHLAKLRFEKLYGQSSNGKTKSPDPVVEENSSDSQIPVAPLANGVTALMDEYANRFDPKNPILDLTTAEVRKEIAVAKLKELEVQQRMGELVSFSNVEQEWATIAANAQQKVLTVPDRLAVKLARMTNAAEIRQLLRGELIKALEGIVQDVSPPTEV